jgi:hypothetical protein|tara:strand:+ start:649 stop:888 length:240 start_codon:yes stop_codon:yes gene_type:complete
MFTINNEKTMEDAIAILQIMSDGTYKNDFHVVTLNKRMQDLFLEQAKKELADKINNSSCDVSVHMHIDKHRELVEKKKD